MKIRILDRYILANHVGPYFFSLSIITFVFVMDFIINFLDKYVGKGVGFFTVLEFFTLSLGHMFALIIPMAVMPATLMAFGQLAADNEVTAIRSSGISLYRMIAPVLVATAALAVALVFYFNMLLPESNHRLMNLMIDIGRMKPTLQIKENIFSDAVQGYTILVREKNDKTGEIKGVQIFDFKGGVPRVIIAASGRMTYHEGESMLQFELDNGEIHEMPDPGDIRTYRRTEFKHFTLNIQDTDRALRRSERSHRDDREMTVGMMLAKRREFRQSSAETRERMNTVALNHMVAVFSRVIPDFRDLVPGTPPPPPPPAPTGEMPAVPRIEGEAEQIRQILETQVYALDSNLRQINRYSVEINKKFAIPFSCIIFVLLGAPLAVRSGRRGMTMSIGFSIVLFIVYYIFLNGGEKLADRRLMYPWLSMWLGNIVFFAVAVVLLRQTNRESAAFNLARLDPRGWWRRADS
jgi:lipopolysaccharide export system permease protein